MLIVEDQPGDLKIAAEAAGSIHGVSIEARTNVSATLAFLSEAIEKNSVPNVIILDLDLGYESGFEILRVWHSTPELSKVEVIVWTILGTQQQELCRLFNVKRVVPKWDGAAGLRRALESTSIVAS